MIIMINGSFGVGKTVTAQALVQRWPEAMCYDPETVGGMLRELTQGVSHAQETTDDFRDLQLWPELVVMVARSLHRMYERPLIVPMTIDDKDMLHAIRMGFSSFTNVQHYCLTAPLDVIEQRIRQRAEGNVEWTLGKAHGCNDRFAGPDFAEYIDAQHNSPEQIAAFIHQRADP